jgi:hypothetical protein
MSGPVTIYKIRAMDPDGFERVFGVEAASEAEAVKVAAAAGELHFYEHAEVIAPDTDPHIPGIRCFCDECKRTRNECEYTGKGCCEFVAWDEAS